MRMRKTTAFSENVDLDYNLLSLGLYLMTYLEWLPKVGYLDK